MLSHGFNFSFFFLITALRQLMGEWIYVLREQYEEDQEDNARCRIIN